MKLNYEIVIIGLGYVGLPLALEFGKKSKCIGYDKSPELIKKLKKKNLNEKKYKRKNLSFTNELNKKSLERVFIITVPTPIYANKKPNLEYVLSASREIAKIINKNDLIIYESTFAPGTTRNICIPQIEKISKLKSKKDFYYGYSPERINPGDKKYTLSKIKKLVSGCCSFSLNRISEIYKSINIKTIHCDNIEIAESSKIVENIQRDVNIALMNELNKYFLYRNINFSKVLKAAYTKWNFAKYTPGLVGGHCIAVDPYYLINDNKTDNSNLEIIETARIVNDKYDIFIFNELIKKIKLKFKKTNIKKISILIFGASFKKNVGDIRNSKNLEIIKLFLKNKFNVKVYDPLIDLKKIINFKKIFINDIRNNDFNLFIKLVDHDIFNEEKIKKLIRENYTIDIKKEFNF